MGLVLVTGATGMLGRAVVPELQRIGMRVRATSRSPRVASEGGPEWVVADFTTGEGVERAVEGVETVVHLAAAPYKGRYTEKVEVDGTKRLLDATDAHVVYVSIVGVDRVPWGYFRTKLKAEELLRGRASIIRSTQFFPFVDRALRFMAKTGVMVMDPGIRAQPVDVDDVARRLGERIAQGPSGTIEEFGGPQVLATDEAMRHWLSANGKRRPILRLRMPGKLGAAFRSGALTTTAQPAGTKTWWEFLTT
ncbi:MAG TPA: NAD(P)H-binding protein [Candidatus Limnocylindrales bacterium]